MDNHFLFIDQFSGRMDVGDAVEDMGFTVVLPYYELAIYRARNDHLELLISTNRSYGITVFAMHLEFLSYDVIFQDLTSPKAPHEQVFSP